MNKTWKLNYGSSLSKSILLFLLLASYLMATSQTPQTPDWVVTSPCLLDRPAVDFRIKIADTSQAFVHQFAPLVAGDMDGDGICEIAIAGSSFNTGYYTVDSIMLFQGNDLSKCTIINLPQTAGAALHSEVSASSAALAMVKGPMNVPGIGSVDTSLLLVASADMHVYAFNKAGQEVWRSDSTYSNIYKNPNDPSTGDRWMKCISVGDINNDGNVEIVVGNAVFNMNGQKLLAFDQYYPKMLEDQNWNYGGTGQFVLVDLDSDGTLEYIRTNKVYKFDITNPSGVAGNTMTLSKTLAGFDRGSMGNTSVADMNGSGTLDIIFIDSSGLYLWDPLTESLMDSVRFPKNTYVGFPFVGDIDGDEAPEIIFCTTVPSGVGGSPFSIFACKYDIPTKKLKQFWRLAHSDGSGATGMSLFDFNSDGIMQICYRDERTLRIINGSLKSHLTGADTSIYTLASFPCGSATAIEYPIIADVDGNGSANIIISGSPNGKTSNLDDAKLFVFSSLNEDGWAWARPVWNQYIYNAVNVNQDLSLPIVQIDPAIKISDGSGAYTQPYNSFYQQHSTQDSTGRYVVEGAALTLDTITQAFNSSGDSLLFTLTISNHSEHIGYPATDSALAFYCGIDESGTLLWVAPMPAVRAAQQVQYEVMLPSSALVCNNSLFIQMNDDGQGLGVNPNFPPMCNSSDYSKLSCFENLRDNYAVLHLGENQVIDVTKNDVVINPITAINTDYLNKGSVVLNADNTITYNSDGINLGVDSFLYYSNNGVSCLDSAMVYVAVMINDSLAIDSTNKEVIGANDITWDLRYLTELNETTSKDSSKVAAYGLYGKSIPVDEILVNDWELQNILNQLSDTVLPLSYFTELGTTVNTNVTLIGKITNPAITAERVVWRLSDLPSYSIAIAPDTAHVHAIDGFDTPVPRAEITVDTLIYDAIIAGNEAGVFGMKYRSPDTSTTAPLIILDNDSIFVNPKNGEVIGANDFTWEIKYLSLLDANTSKDTSKVRGYFYDGKPIPSSSIVANFKELSYIKAQTVAGVYPLSFSTVRGTRTRVQVSLTGEVFPPKITADAVVWKLEDLPDYLPSNAPDTAHVEAIDRFGDSVPRNQIQVDLVFYNALIASNSAGVHPMKYQSPDTSILENVIVLDNDSVQPNPMDQEVIAADDFSWDLYYLSQLDAEMSKDTSHVIAYHYDGSKIDPSTILVDQAQLDVILAQMDPIVLPLSFSTPLGTKVTIRVSLEGNPLVSPTISADDVVWRLSDLSSYTKTIAPDTAHVQATDRNGMDVSLDEIVVDDAMYQAIQQAQQTNVFPMVYYSPDTRFAAHVLVIDNDSITPNPNEKEVIAADDFEWDIDKLRDLDETKSKEAAHVVAFYYDGTSIPQSEIIVDQTQFQEIKAQVNPIVKPLTFSTPLGSAVTINVKLVQDSKFRGELYVRPDMSPNNDGLGNDKMYIENIIDFPQNNVSVFDRVGHILYRAEGYNNSTVAFDGFPNQKVAKLTNKVPIGTYYYIVNYFDDRDHTWKKLSGYVEVQY